MTRHFWKCADCLTVVAVETEIKPTYDNRGYPHYATCGACSGEMEYIGRVERNRLVRTDHVCPCDGRCTNATGPSCDCQCGGANHGSGVLVPVTVEIGQLPRIEVKPDAAKRADEYRALYQQVRAAWDARYREITERKRCEYLSGGAYSLFLEGQDQWAQVRKARSLRTHAGRQKKLAAVLASLQIRTGAAA